MPGVGATALPAAPALAVIFLSPGVGALGQSVVIPSLYIRDEMGAIPAFRSPGTSIAP